MRTLIVNTMERQGMNPYRLAQAVKGKVTAQAVYDYIAGRSDMTSRFVQHLLDALGLEVRPKR